MIIVVVLQNSMDLQQCELGSSSKTCVTSTFNGNEVTGVEAETVTVIKEEEDQEQTTIPEIKTEPNVSVVPVLNVCTFIIGCIQNYRLRWSRGSVLAFSTEVRRFKPGLSLQIFKGEKILSTPSFGGEVKPSVPCRRFAACKRSLNGVEIVISAKLPDNILAHSSHYRRWDLSRRGGCGGTWW